jgi:hypothetical protein
MERENEKYTTGILLIRGLPFDVIYVISECVE